MATVALGGAFQSFLTALCLLQIGLLISVPTASAITAQAAPSDMRGRCMGLLSLAGWIGFGLGPGASSTITWPRWRPGTGGSSSAWRRPSATSGWPGLRGIAASAARPSPQKRESLTNRREDDAT